MEAVVVGGGLVGYLTACYISKKGFTVNVYEKYPDPRTQGPGCSRSINLTLSHRGKGPLKEVDLLDSVLEGSVPAFGRVARDGNGKILGRVYYGEKGESIHSISRYGTNIKLLNAADDLENVTINFSHELILCDFDEGTATFSYTEDGETKYKTVSADLFIGADGAHSAMRAEMAKHRKLDLLHFKYHEHYYMEMLIPATKEKEYPLDKNWLHVWPKDSYVLICLPNPDKSFTGTLVMPKEKFDEMLQSEESLLKFWREDLNMVYNLVGEDNLINQFRPGKLDVRTPCRLASFKGNPYHARSASGSKFLLLGDAAHAMVPFYGQGMNTGFEDVQIFGQALDKHGITKEGISNAVEEFSLKRYKDGQAMSDFSYDHYENLCSKVKKPNYNFRRHIDSFLHRFFPNRWIPEYTLIAFSETPQSQCREICKKQDQILGKFKLYLILIAIMLTPFGVVMAMLWDA